MHKILAITIIVILLPMVYSVSLTSSSEDRAKYIYFDPQQEYSVTILLCRNGVDIDFNRLRNTSNFREIEYNIPFKGLVKAYMYLSHSKLFYVILAKEPLFQGKRERVEKIVCPVITITPKLDLMNITGYGYLMETRLYIKDLRKFVEPLIEVGYKIVFFHEVQGIHTSILVKRFEDTIVNTTIEYNSDEEVLRVCIIVSSPNRDLIEREILDLKQLLGINDYLFEEVYPVYGGLLHDFKIMENYRELLEKTVSYEIRWLIENNLLKSISEQEFKDLPKILEPGLCGWNNRLVYINGKWIIYREIQDISIIYSYRAPYAWIQVDQLPVNPPVITSESKTQSSQSIQSTLNSNTTTSGYGSSYISYNMLLLVAVLLITILLIAFIVLKTRH